MSGKDLLAVLVMIVPGFVLIALIAFTLVPASVMQPFPGSGVLRGDSRRQMAAQPGMQKAHVTREVAGRSAPGMATQKRMRDPWKSQRSKSSSTA